MKNCGAFGCNRKILAKGLCNAHYSFFLRNGLESTLNHQTGKTKIKFDGKHYVGKESGYLTILEFTKIVKLKTGQFHRYCLCKCRCGSIKEYMLNNIKSGMSQSCGCKPYVNHNPYVKTRSYRIYSGMIQRCYNPITQNYKHYGGRGIKICDRWVESFYNFLEDMGQPPDKKLSIDRIDNEGDYTPQNCRWATRLEQNRNQQFSSKNVLNTVSLSLLTGYTSERIRQLTGPTNSKITKVFPLKDFIEKSVKAKKRTHYIYKPESIDFLKQRKLLKVNNAI